MDKTDPGTLFSGSSQSLLLEYIRGDMNSQNPVYALYESKNYRTTADTICTPYLKSAQGR